MALNGEFSNYPVTGLGLYCTWSATQNIVGNYSDVTLNVYLYYYTIDVGARSDSTISINGVSETYTAPSITDYAPGYKTRLLKIKTLRVNHNSDGSKNNVPLSAYWRFSGVYSGTSVGGITASTTINLNKIDRTAPTVTTSISNIGVSGFTLKASSSANANLWQYSTDNGATWITFSSINGTSASTTVSGLAPNTSYKVQVRARKSLNQVYGKSSITTVNTLGGTRLNSASVITADNSSVGINFNTTVYNSSYTHTLKLIKDGTTLVEITGLRWGSGTDNRSLTLTSTQRSTILGAMKNIKSFTGKLSVTSYNGSTQIGNASVVNVTVQTTPANSAPTLSAFATKDSNTTTSAVTGNNQLYIECYSTLLLTPGAASAKNAANIVRYTAVCNGYTVSNTTGEPLNLGVIRANGSVDIVLTVTDSRGYTKSVYKELTVIPYEKPKIRAMTLRRTNNIEKEIQLVFSGSISPITVSGVQKNSLIAVFYQYKQTSATSYGSFINIPIASVSKNGVNFSYSNLELLNLDTGSSFDFIIQLQDKLGHSTAINFHYVIPQGTPLIALRKGKVGINKANPVKALDVVGDSETSGTHKASQLIGPLKTGTTGRISFVHDGQYKILEGTTERFNLSHVSPSSTATLYAVLSGTTKALNISYSSTVGQISKTCARIDSGANRFDVYMPSNFTTVNATQWAGAYKISGSTVLEYKSNGFHIGEPNGLYTYIAGRKYGGFSAAYDNYLTLGRSDYRWMSLWVVSGVVQTSGKCDKEHIQYLNDPLDDNKNSCSEEDFYNLLDKIADGLCTFKYKGQDEAYQLGVIADEIDDHPAYAFIGTKEVVPESDEKEEHTVHGLNPLPVAMLSIAGYRRQKEQIDELTKRIERLEQRLDSAEKALF